MVFIIAMTILGCVLASINTSQRHEHIRDVIKKSTDKEFEILFKVLEIQRNNANESTNIC